MTSSGRRRGRGRGAPWWIAVALVGGCPYDADSDGWRATASPTGGCPAGDVRPCECPTDGRGQQSCDDGAWSACGGCAGGDTGEGGGPGTTTSAGGAEGDVCTNNGAPDCAIVFGEPDCDACAHDACCSEIASCADDPACCNLFACYAEHCGGSADAGACLEASCAEFAIDLRRRFLYLPVVCLPEQCAEECQ